LANSLVVGRADKAWQCKICDESNKPLTSHYIHHTVKDIKCIISVYKDFAVLGFRYTNSLKNVWQDILYPFQVVDEGTCKKCKVQKVYHNMWNSLRYNITVDLMKINSENKIDTLYITGISLGGGLAIISFVDIFNDKLFKNLHVVVFGSPKVGNKHWADWYD
jgi:predicted lipase